MSEYYYLDHNRQPQGPCSLAELSRLRAAGHIDDSTYAAPAGATTWQPLVELLPAAALPPLPVVPAPLPVAPPAFAAPTGFAGNCPSCNKAISIGADRQLPPQCPHCRYHLRVEGRGILANFLAALGKYATLTGRATRAEFWSFVLTTHALSAFFLAICCWPFLRIAATTQEEIDKIGTERVLNMSEREQQAYGRHLGEVIEAQASDPTSSLAFAIGALGLILCFLAFICPFFCVACRRLHDSGKSGWLIGIWFLAAFAGPILLLPTIALGGIPYFILNGLPLLITLGGIVLLFYFYCLDSQRGANSYGPSPKYPLG